MALLDNWRGRPRSALMAPTAIFESIDRMMRDFDEAFDRSPTFPSAPLLWQNTVPACDCAETDDKYLISFDVPGVKKDDIEINISGTVLTIRGERKTQQGLDATSTRYSEPLYGSFERSFTLPKEIDVDKVEATCENGVLSVMLPKSSGVEKHKIPIKTGRDLLDKAKDSIEIGTEKAKEMLGAGKKERERAREERH